MDVLEPKLVWVEGRCYRFIDANSWSRDGKALGSYVEETYETDYISNDEESTEARIEIEPVNGGRCKHSFYVNSHFYRFIIGAKGATLKRLTSDTKTHIKVPMLGEDGDVVITGYNHRDIMAARSRIDMLIETSRNKLNFTHFLSIPCNLEEIKENFEKFREIVLKSSDVEARGISENIFQKPEKLHLTIVMLVLLDENDRTKAVEALETCNKQIIMPIIEKNGPITIELRGLDIMNDDPSEVNILYIQVHDTSGCLQEIVNKITHYFVDHGITGKQSDGVKMHITAMNTKFSVKEAQNYSRNKIKFDATSILKAHENFYFGKMSLSSIHLSQMYKKASDGYYLSTAKIEFANT